MADHKKRFARWRKKLPPRSSYLVQQVLDRIVPEFEARGFAWYPNYAGGDPKAVGYDTIPLQRRQGDHWPTVELQFAKYGRPWFTLHFSVLPKVCYKRSKLGVEPVPRERATIYCGPGYFMLCRGERQNLDGEFGSPHWLSLRPYRCLDADIDKAVGLLPVVFGAFDRGIPETWLVSRELYVHKHVMKKGSWADLRESARAAALLVHPGPQLGMWRSNGQRLREVQILNHKERFAHWRRELAPRTSYLVDGVLDRIVSRLEAQNYVWYPHYAGGHHNIIPGNAIPLQRRQGRVWPTVQLHFAKSKRPQFRLYFGELPETCFGLDHLAARSVTREEASIGCGPAYFELCKGRGRSRAGHFGYKWISLRPRRRLEVDLNKAVALLPFLVNLLDRGIPQHWLASPPGCVHKNVRLVFSWRDFEQKRRMTREQVESLVGGGKISTDILKRRLEKQTSRADSRVTLGFCVIALLAGPLMGLYSEWSLRSMVFDSILLLVAIGFAPALVGSCILARRKVAEAFGLRCPLCSWLPYGDAAIETIDFGRCQKCLAPLEPWSRFTRVSNGVS